MKKIFSTIISSPLNGRLCGLLFALLATTTSLWAHEFSVNGIYYNYLDGNNVAVTYMGGDYDAYSNEYYGEVIIPETVTYNGTTYSVTSIEGRAFSGCSSLTSITIPNSVTSIGGHAFYKCSLTSITIPNSVTSIGKYAFSNCSKLTSITWNAENYSYIITSSDSAPFYGIRSQITEFIFGDKVLRIPSYLCYDMNHLTSISIPNSVTSIGEYAFRFCSSLTSITIPNSVTSIGDQAFYGCHALTSVTIGNSVTSIGEGAFYGTGIYNDESNWENEVLYIDNYLIKATSSISGLYTIKENTRLIADDAFIYCSSLTSITIPNSVTSIGNFAFDGCSALREITLPASLKVIGSSAFADCPRIYEVTCLAPEPPIAEESSFTNYDAYFHAYCDAQRYYSVDPVWKRFHNVECIVNENTITNNVTITPSDCEATVVWLSNDAAAAYSLVITRNGVTCCTLRFNKYGQLTNISLAPSRTHNQQQAAESTETGYSFTITGLDAGTKYDYQFSVLNDSNESIDEYFGEFTTQSNTSTDLENVGSQLPMTDCKKILRDGQLLIIRNGKTYTITGQKL